MDRVPRSSGSVSSGPSPLWVAVLRFRFVALASWIIATLGWAAVSIALGLVIEELPLVDLLASHCGLVIAGWVGVGLWPFMVSFAAHRLDGNQERPLPKPTP